MNGSPSRERRARAPERRGRLAALLALLVLVVATVLGACARPAAVRFPHRAHLNRTGCGGPGQRACLSCSGCHTPSATERTHKLPPASECDACHAKNPEAVRAVLAVAPKRPAGEIAFEHPSHLAMPEIGGQCVPCHAGVVEGGSRIPPMKECFRCHEHQAQWERGECTPCHTRAALARTMPRTFLKHEGTFAREHGAFAQRDAQLCRSCHEQADCDDCHDVSQKLTVERRRPEKIDRTFQHRADFLTRHALEAQGDPARCVRCHEPSTCDACHEQRGVSGNVVGGRSPHPPGWVGNDPGVRTSHGREARRDVVLCAGCHEQGPATNCVRCHKVGGYGGNPHPSGWRSARDEHDATCRYCHE